MHKKSGQTDITPTGACIARKHSTPLGVGSVFYHAGTGGMASSKNDDEAASFPGSVARSEAASTQRAAIDPNGFVMANKTCVPLSRYE